MASLRRRRNRDGSTSWDVTVRRVGYPTACKSFPTRWKPSSGPHALKRQRRVEPATGHPAAGQTRDVVQFAGQAGEQWGDRGVLAARFGDQVQGSGLAEERFQVEGLPGRGETESAWKELFGENFAID